MDDDFIWQGSIEGRRRHIIKHVGKVDKFTVVGVAPVINQSYQKIQILDTGYTCNIHIDIRHELRHFNFKLQSLENRTKDKMGVFFSSKV